MASLNKLAIRGIRSFDDKQISVIEFFSPVTVIVGHNGSGKTTIIECLKYATTGDQPANTRGGAFIHDPKMANEKEVKAQVKLRFHAANGTRMLAVRNLSVTMKKTTLSMKTLENILALADGNGDKGGKRAVISTKCAEMDVEIPQLLGVSKAVLENVIFCHQEDSYWPLSEPGVLKKKFDDIFEATRYTKALESIKGLRKDRVAELKAEKERLVGLAREKSHSDKLKSRATDLSSTIATKEVEYEEKKRQHDAQAAANQKFYDDSTTFRELYIKAEYLDKKKESLQADLDDAKLNLQEITGTDGELDLRLKHFDDHINVQRQKRRTKDVEKQDLEDEMNGLRAKHTELVTYHGRLTAEAEAQKQRIAERELLIREISDKHGIKGYNYSPLEREKVVEFLSRLGDVQRKQKTEFEKLQNDVKAKTEDYNRKSRQLYNELEGYKLQKKNLRDNIADRQSSIITNERELEKQQSLSGDLRTLQGDIEEKKARLEKTRNDIKNANYDERLAEKMDKSRRLEEKRDALNKEIRTLSLQADTRAKLNFKRGDVKSKTLEIRTILDNDNTKFFNITNRKITVESFEKDVLDILAMKEQEQLEAESEFSEANSNLQRAEANLTTLKKQISAKTEELRKLDRRLKNEYDSESLEVAIKLAIGEVNLGISIDSNFTGTSKVYDDLLKTAETKRICGTCNRHLNDQEYIAFEANVKEILKKASAEAKVEDNKSETKDWAQEVERLQGLVPVQAARDQLRHKEVPGLEGQLRQQDSTYPDLQNQVEDATDRLDSLKRQMKDLNLLKQHADTIARLRKEIERAKQEIESLEADLSATDSTKTADEVQMELDELSAELRMIEREKQSITKERDNQVSAVRTFEASVHHMELREKDLTSEIREKATLEDRISKMNAEIASFTAQSKVLDDKISESQIPIDTLESEHQNMQTEATARINQAQHLLQELNISVDKLSMINKGVERYAKERRARELEECTAKVEACDADIRDLSNKIENVREVINKIDKEINESGASVANLRDNIRVRKLVKDIQDTQTEMDLLDMEEAARARRNFDTQFPIAKEKERNLHTAYSHIAGEISSLKSQLKALESDLKEFKDVNKMYTDQLIRVKVSDMANSDLEKYAKALDNAIMKYHGLKMEEVNDTMKHLWNKTYQGTDIDGIKIRSDVEGGASKRSYNYRVVMTKDQVEMDMRGRCSAGQKMLASIIIRLALSDSFGQNCGILALDEPTNALDTENIDALADSLVDIINERKAHSNFQLIIITHDENFLRKLGQSDVMEYYWRVSRDSRQKSVIERQRFR